MMLRIFIICFHLMTLKPAGIYSNDQESYVHKWLSLMNRTGHWPEEVKLMVKYFSQVSTNEDSQTPANVSSDDHSFAPFLMPVFIVPTETMYIGSVISDKAVLTSCSSTVVPIEDGSVLYVKPEQILVIIKLTIASKITPVVTGVMEVRRHPTCEQPYREGSWKNDVAILLLPIAIMFEPKVLEPIKLPSLDFYEIYSAIKKKVWDKSTCYAVFMKYQGDTLPRIKTFLPVKIQASSPCPRRCGYMIDHCTQELGGYSIIHLSNTTNTSRQDATHGAAIMCDGRIYGVLRPNYSCGYDSFGHLPKPEAMLYMYVNFADPKIKPKPIIASNSSEWNGSNVAVDSFILLWVIALSIKFGE